MVYNYVYQEGSKGSAIFLPSPLLRGLPSFRGKWWISQTLRRVLRSGHWLGFPQRYLTHPWLSHSPSKALNLASFLYLEAPTGDLPSFPSLASFPDLSHLSPLAELCTDWFFCNSLQFGMSTTVTHVVRSERETSEAWIPLLLVHRYDGIISETFQFNVMSASYTPITHLLYTYYMYSLGWMI